MCYNQRMTQIIWYKRDLRVRDHAPLFHASQSGEVLPLYILEPFLFEQDVLTKRHLTFITESLIDLKQSLQQIGLTLYIYIGKATDIFDMLHQTYGAFKLHSHMEHGTNLTYQRDLSVKTFIEHHQLTWYEYKTFGVNRAHGFKHRLRDFHQWLHEGIIPIPNIITPFIDSKQLFIHSIGDIASYQVPGTSISLFKGGEAEGIKRAKAFFNERYKKYQVYINKPALSIHSSSLLSPYLAFGNVSIKMLHLSTQKHLKHIKEQHFFFEQLKAFEKRLYWHCHFIQRVEKHPELDYEAWDKKLEGIRIQDDTLLQAFSDGKTGFPIVDACMRALHQRGWINFKQRAMIASFATNVLLLRWQDVGNILAGLFIDYEPGIHWSQIQMQAGLNPYRHVPMYDIIKQSHMHDPHATFIHMMIPELKHIQAPDVFTPWLLDNNPYIKPVIDLEDTFQKHKTLLYGLKKNKKPKDTLFDVVNE